MDEISSHDNEPGARPRRRLRRVALAAAVGLGLALGAVGISAAASPSPSPSAGTTVKPDRNGPQDRGERMRDHLKDGMRGHGMRGHMGLGLRGAVRGDVVVPDGSGGYKTVRLQRGTVTAVSSTALSVKSADGVTQTYVITAKTLVNAARDGIGSVKVGDQVGVLASLSGSTATATHVRDLTQLRAAHPKRPAAPNGTPASPSSYTSSSYGA